MNRKAKHSNIRSIDFIPAVSGIIGKIALVSSFAFVWAQELNITAPNFVFDNVRIEIVIGSLVTFIMALIYPKISPAGTLAPLIVLIPPMASFGVHPMILSLLVGIFGIISVKTKIFEKLLLISGHISKTSLTLVFGVSGVVLSLKELLLFFGDLYVALSLLLFVLGLVYIVLVKFKKAWLIIPIASIVSLSLPLFFDTPINISSSFSPLNLNPSYWWNDMWGIGYGLNALTILKTLPFALFVVLLWTIDTVSTTALLDTNYEPDEKKEELDIDNSFVIISIRNMIGGILGGAQTSALWRSFLIPLYMIKRPIRTATFLLGILGLLVGFIGTPILFLSFPPLIWTVLLFGIFIPLVSVGIKNSLSTKSFIEKGTILLFSALGLLFSPMLTWICGIVYEKLAQKLQHKKYKSG